MLVRLNRELGADFDLGGFAHRAVWNAGASRVEMHLRDMLARAGFGIAAQWERDGFALTLATPSSSTTTTTNDQRPTD